VVVPPLHERGDDVLLLAGHFAEQVRARLGLRALRLDPACTPLLQAYHWPGNVRELEHVIHRAAVLARHRTDGPVATIEPPHLHLAEDLPTGEDGGAEPEAPLPTLREGVEATQRRLINEAHRRAGSWAGAARLLGVDPGNLTRLRQRLGMG
jgi:anaerobic nitric oxide reductase transcription regulator